MLSVASKRLLLRVVMLNVVMLSVVKPGFYYVCLCIFKVKFDVINLVKHALEKFLNSKDSKSVLLFSLALLVVEVLAILLFFAE